MILGSYVISWLFHTFPCFVLQDFVQPTRRMAKEGLVDQRNFTALPLLCASQAGGVAPWALKYVTRWIAVSTCYHKMLPQVTFSPSESHEVSSGGEFSSSMFDWDDTTTSEASYIAVGCILGFKLTLVVRRLALKSCWWFFSPEDL